MNRTISITSPAMPTLLGFNALEVEVLDGHEGLGQLFHYRLRLRTPDNPAITELVAANVPFKQLVGKEITVHIELEGRGFFAPGVVGGAGVNIGAGERQISGLVTAARFVGSENRRGVYEVIVEPWLSLAQRTSDHRIFQNLTVAEILQQVLDDYPYPAQIKLMRSYPKREFQVQYGETDLVFMERLMQEWGLYYHFEHEGETHRLLILDDPGLHQPNPSAAYQVVSHYPPGHKIDEEYCSEFGAQESLQSGQWVTSDFDFKKPRADLSQRVAMPRKTGHAQQEMYKWPGDYTEPDEGRELARVRMEHAGAPGSRATGVGNLRGMVPGHTFRLQHHPQQSANAEYLILGATLTLSEVGEASGQGQYHCHTQFEVQPARHTYRSTQHHPKPHTHGPQTAVVTGPKGREIYTDEYARVKVSFHWNRYCPKDENSSCWIRVASPWAGTNFGGIAIPRIGQEVIVDFENGDPDRPIIIGRVYNAMNMPPWALPANMTQSGVLTRSSENGGPANANALRFEDKKGAEEVWLHAERNLRTEVEKNESHSVGVNRSKSVGSNETTSIGASRSETVGGTHTETIKKQRTLTVTEGGSAETIHGDTSITSVDGNIAVTSAAHSIFLTATTSIVLQVGASSITITDGNIVVNGPKQVDINP